MRGAESFLEGDRGTGRVAALLCGAAGCGLLLAVSLVVVLSGLKEGAVSRAQGGESGEAQYFLRPQTVAPGGTYEIYLDVPGASFSEDTAVAVLSEETAVLETRVRNPEGLTVVLAVGSAQRVGPLGIELEVPLSEGGTETISAEVEVSAAQEKGPVLSFTNLPESERIVCEGGFAYLELSVEGDGPFVVSWGLREKSFWSSRSWNVIGREIAEESGEAVEGPETESFTVALPLRENTLDVVVVDRNGRESCQSLVIETRRPCKLEKARETSLLERLFGRSIAEASCTSSNPYFSFYNISKVGIDRKRDDNGSEPLEFTQSTCQGTVCNGCGGCAGSDDTPLDEGAVSGGGGSAMESFTNAGKVFGHSGEFKITVTDLVIPVPEIDFSIRRTYRSQISYHSRLGMNWDMNVYARYLRYGTSTTGTASADGDMYFYRGDGRRDKYTWLGGTSFQSPDGFYDKFTLDATSLSQEIRYKNGSRMVFTESQIGSKAVFGKLSYIYGRRTSNWLHFTYDINGKISQITSSVGVTLAFEYDTSGYLSRIYQTNATTNEVKYYRDDGQGTHDPVLNKAQYAQATFYEYDSGGDLTAVTGQRRTVGYGYDTASSGDIRYNLTSIRDGRGFRGNYDYVSLTYGTTADNKYDRVSTYTINPGGFSGDSATQDSATRYTFTYSIVSGSTRKTSYTLTGLDSEEVSTALKRVDFEYNDAGGVLKRTEKTGDGTTTLGVWNYERNCTCNKATKIEDPNGFVEWFEYDSYGNLTRRIVDDGDGSKDNKDLVWLYKYDLPYYVQSGKYGGIREYAAPNVVTAYDESIDTITAPKKTRYTYNSYGDLEKVEPPEFTDASTFSTTGTHTAERSYTYNMFGQVSTETVKLDETELTYTTYDYYTTGSAKCLLWKVTYDPDGLGLTKTYSYTAMRDVASVTDPRGNTTYYDRNADRVVWRVRPPGASTDEYTVTYYDADKNVVCREVGGNSTGETFCTYYVYDEVNRVTEESREIVTSLASVTLTRYDGEGHVVEVTKTTSAEDAKEITTHWMYEWETSGTVPYRTVTESRSGTGESGFAVSETWYLRGIRLDRRLRYADDTQTGGTWYVYDGYGRLRLTVSSPDTNPDTNGLPPSSDSATYYGTLVSYDRNGNRTRVEEGVWQYSANGDGPLEETEYQYKSAVDREYDELNRVRKVTRYQDYERSGTSGDPSKTEGAIVTATKHLYGGRIEKRRKVIGSENADTGYSYDAISRMTKVTYPDGNSYTEYTYDENGNVLTQKSADYVSSGTTKISVTRRSYDSRNRLTQVVIEGEDNSSHTKTFQKTVYGYDFRGNVSEVTVYDQGSPGTALVTNKFEYDGLNRLTKAIYASGTGNLNVINQVIYNDSDRAVTKRDGESHDTVYEYDKVLDVVRKITYANDQENDPDNTLFSYDRLGRLVSKASAVSTDTPSTWDVTYTYDRLGRLLTRTVGSPETGEEKTSSFTYDWRGRVLTAAMRLKDSTGNDSEVVRTYNDLFLVQETQWWATGPGTFTIKTKSGSSTGYDSGGRRVHLEYPNTASLSLTAKRELDFSYDISSRLTKITDAGPDPDETLAEYEYVGPGLRVSKVKLYEGGVHKFDKILTYDHLRRPTSTEYKTTTTLVKYTETWGDGTSETKPVFSRVGFQKTGDLQKTYTYDALGRLASYTVGSGTSTLYEYDKANNRTKKGPSGNQITYTYNASNELTTATGFSGFSHDSHGNLAVKDRSNGTDQRYDYDPMNRVVEYDPGDEGGSTCRYYYDALGRRVLKDDGTNSKKHYYFYDGWRVVLELIDDGQSTSVREYVYGNGLDEVLVEKLPDGGSQKTFWPLADTLGTVRDLADLNNGTPRLRMKYDYDPDGNVTETTAAGSTIKQDVLFTGRWIDRETGISGLEGAQYYYRYRQYEAELARFAQRDPIGVWGDDGNLGNGYAYVGNDPVNGVDPLGLYVGDCPPWYYGDPGAYSVWQTNAILILGDSVAVADRAGAGGWSGGGAFEHYR